MVNKYRFNLQIPHQEKMHSPGEWGKDRQEREWEI